MKALNQFLLRAFLSVVLCTHTYTSPFPQFNRSYLINLFNMFFCVNSVALFATSLVWFCLKCTTRLKMRDINYKEMETNFERLQIFTFSTLCVDFCGCSLFERCLCVISLASASANTLSSAYIYTLLMEKIFRSFSVGYRWIFPPLVSFVHIDRTVDFALMSISVRFCHGWRK